MPLQTSEAVVIGGKNLGEADRIVAFYTREKGKVRAVAEGARRIRSRFGGSLELFAYGKLVYFERTGRTLHRINEFALMEPFRALREDLDLFVHGSYLLELIEVSMEEGEANEELFSLLLSALRLLNLGKEPAALHRAFEIRLLKILGYLPELERCVLCKTSPERFVGAVHEPPLQLSPSQGGLLCHRCSSTVRDGLPLSPPSLAFLRQALQVDLHLLNPTGLSPAQKEELQSILRACLLYFLGRTLRTADFLSRLNLEVGGWGLGVG